MRRFRLTARALGRLYEIGRYTKNEWGVTQRDAYLQALDNRFQTLAAMPYMGKPRPELSLDLYSALEKTHVIFYTITDDEIQIVDILHQQMEPALHLYTQ